MKTLTIPLRVPGTRKRYLGFPSTFTQLIRKFCHIFGKTPRGTVKGATHRIVTEPHTRPIVSTPYRTSPKVKEDISKQTSNMLDNGIIEPSYSQWSSPVVVVKKKDGSPRFCVDYRKLNALTVRDVYPLPRIDDALDIMGNARYFTTLDCCSGYWQIPMSERDKEKTAFITHEGVMVSCA